MPESHFLDGTSNGQQDGEQQEHFLDNHGGGDAAPVQSGPGVDIGLTFTPQTPRDNLAKYGKYGVNLNPFADLNEERARRQSRIEKWGHGMVKMGVTTAGAVAENTLGLLFGVGEAIAHWDKTKLFDNSVGNLVDSINEHVNEALPNYYTQQEMDAEGFEALGYANFWADKFLNGAGYALGSIASLALTGGASGLTITGGLARGAKAAGTLAKTGKMSKALASYNAARTVATQGTKAGKVGSATAALGEATAGASRAQRALNATKQLEVATMMSWAEASVEARERLRDTEQQLLEQYAADKGISVEQVPNNVQQQIKKKAASAGNTAFGLNLIALSITNSITFGKMLGPGYMKKMKAESLLDPIEKVADGKFANMFALDPTWANIYRKYGKNIIVPGVTETAQESSQFAISEYANNRAFGKNWLESFNQSMEELYSSQEGFESAILGGLIGIATGGLGSIRSAKAFDEKQKRTQEVVDMLNSDGFYKDLRTFENSEEGQRYMADMAEQQHIMRTGRDFRGRFASKRDAERKFRTAEAKMTETEVLGYIQRGAYDQLMTRLNDARSMSDEAFAEAFGYTNGEVVDKEKTISNIENRAKELKEIHESLEERFPTPGRTQGMARALMSPEAREAEDNAIRDIETYKRLLYTNSASLQDLDARIEQLYAEVTGMVPTDPSGQLSMFDLTKEDVTSAGTVIDIALDAEGNEVFVVSEEAQDRADRQQDVLVEGATKVATTARAIESGKGALEARKFLKKANDLLLLANQRRAAVNAINNLMSPDAATRDLALSRAKAEERRVKTERVDNEYRAKVQDTTTAEELEAMIRGGLANASPELVAEVEKLKRERKAAESAIEKEYMMMSLADLKNLEETDPVRKHVLERHRKYRGENNLQDPIVAPEPKPATQEQQPASTDETAGEGVEDFDMEGAEEAMPVDGEGTVEETVDLIGDEDAKAQVDMLKVATGELPDEKDLATGKRRVTVDSTGTPQGIAFDSRHTVDGRPLDIRREVLSSPEFNKAVSDGKADVEFRLVETDWAKDNPNPVTYPIGIYYKNELIGLLGAGKPGSQRVDIYNKLAAGEKVTSRVTETLFGNYTSTINGPNGNPAFRPLGQVFGDGEIKLLINREGKWEANGALTDQEIEELGGRYEGSTQWLNAGQVAVVVRRPDGVNVPVILHTRKLHDRAQKKLLEMISAGGRENFDLAKELAGFSVLNPNSSTQLDFINGDIVYTTPVEVGGERMIMKISNENLQNAVAGKDFKYTLGKFEENPNSPGLSKFVADPAMSSQQLQDMKESMRANATSSVQNLKFQIAKDRINTTTPYKSPLTGRVYEKGYMEYLSDATYEITPQEAGEDVGATILQTDLIQHNGSVFYDVGLNFDYNTEQKPATQAKMPANDNPVNPPQEQDSNDETLVSTKTETRSRKAPRTTAAPAPTRSTTEGEEFTDPSDITNGNVTETMDLSGNTLSVSGPTNPTAGQTVEEQDDNDYLLEEEASRIEGERGPDGLQTGIFAARSSKLNYTNGQVVALHKIEKLIDDRKSGKQKKTTYFLMAGYAGTGKTTMAENIVRYNGGAPIIIAPTNKAARVLQTKLEDSGTVKRGSEAAQTIHKFMYGEPNENGQFTLSDKRKPTGRLIIVDEASMIDKKVMDELHQFTRGGNNIVVFMGDGFQLQPISQDPKLFDGKVDFITDSVQLTEVRRQALESNILGVATAMRKAGKAILPDTSSGDVTVRQNPAQLELEFHKAMQAGEDAVYITATNRRRITVNHSTRRAKFGTQNPAPLLAGERLISIANSATVSNSEMFTLNNPGEGANNLQRVGMQMTMSSGQTKDIELLVGEVMMDGSKKPTPIILAPNIDMPSLYHQQVTKALRSDSRLKADMQRAGIKIETNRRGEVELGKANIIATYGYAVTAHKSQGSQWNKVFVEQNYSAPSWDSGRWLYTAITRAAEQLEVVNTQYSQATPMSQINGLSRAYRLRKRPPGPQQQARINEKKAEKWLKDRFGDNSVVIFNALKRIGDATVMGYVERGAAYIYSNAEVGTEYHEGFHLLFRTALNKNQRRQLFDDAVKQFGEPTREEIQEARRGQPDMLFEQARQLALEEKMAEAFREYVLSENSEGLLARIGKFFADMLAYVKALVGRPLTVRQAFRLLESDKIPNQFFRKAEAFAGTDTAYMMVEDYSTDPQLFEEITDIAVLQGLNHMDLLRQAGRPAITSEIFGIAGQADSALRNWFLYHSFSQEDGSPLTDEQFAKLKSIYDSEGDLVKYMESENLFDDPPSKLNNGQAMPKKTSGSAKAGVYFRHVYENWFTEYDENSKFPSRPGYREAILEKLNENFGVKEVRIGSEEMTDEDQKTEERIYNKSRLEESPALRMSQKARRLLARIPIGEDSDSRFGFKTYIPVSDVYSALVGATYNSKNFDEMLVKLQSLSQLSRLAPAIDVIKRFTPRQKALLFSNLGMTLNEFVIARADGKGQMYLFSPNAKTVSKYFTRHWKLGSESTTTNSAYRVERDMNGVITKRTLNADKAQLEKDFEVLTARDERGRMFYSVDKVKALHNILTASGVYMGEDEQTSLDRLTELMGQPGFGIYKFLHEDTNLATTFKDSLMSEDDIAPNVHEIERKTIRHLAGLMRKFEQPRAMSFLNNRNKAIFPINAPTQLTRTVMDVKDGTMDTLFTGAHGHDVGNKKTLMKRLLESQGYRDIFGVFDVDGYNVKNKKTDYKNMSPLESLLLRMGMFVNNSSKQKITHALIPVLTQGDRGRMSAQPFPKLHSLASKKQFGIDAFETNTFILEQIMLDLHRGYQAQLDIDQGKGDLQGYHTNEQFKKSQFGDKVVYEEDLAQQVYEHLQNGIPLSETAQQALDERVNIVVQQIEGYVKQVEKFLGGAEVAEAQILTHLSHEGLTAEGFMKNVEGAQVLNTQDFLKAFVTTTVMATVSLNNLYRSGVNFTSDPANFIKRMTLVSSPAIPLYIDPTGQYGMSETYTAATVKDLSPGDKSITAAVAKANAEGVKASLIKKGVSAEAADIERARVEQEYAENVNSTDAQAFITLDMHRRMRQGIGEWTDADEAAFKQYQQGGAFDGNLQPVKPTHNGMQRRDNLVVPYADKNSYVILTREFVKNHPILKDLHDRMNGVGEYEGMPKIDVVNMDSANKLGMHSPTTVNNERVDGRYQTGQFTAMTPITMNSQHLGMSQTIPELTDEKVEKGTTFGRQIRKGIIANVSDTGTYYTNPGVTGVEQKITGKQMKAMYHKAISEKIKRAKAKLMSELGMDKIYDHISMATTEQKKDAAWQREFFRLRNEAMNKIQGVLYSRGKKNDLPDNILQGLKILATDDVAGLRFATPLSFPTMGRSFDQLVFSAFRKEVAVMKLPGFEAVQFADFGGHEVDGELSFAVTEEKGKHIRAAQIDIREDVLREFGIDPGLPLDEINTQLKRMVGYRIPYASLNLSLVFEVRHVLPKNYRKAVRVPGELTMQMGSDFDIDKLYLLFPEVNEKGEKVQPDYSAIKNNTDVIEKLGDKAINNILFDTMESVLSSKLHADEIFAPLDIADIKQAVQEVHGENALDNLKDFDLLNPMTAVKTGYDNMLSSALRGIYANGIAGRNVAVSLPVDVKSTGKNGLLKFEGETLDKIVTQSPFNDVVGIMRYTDYYISQFLSAAVDSVKLPLQALAMDNADTAPVIVGLTSLGMTPLQIITLLNHPVIAEGIAQAEANDVPLGKVFGTTQFAGDLTMEMLEGPRTPENDELIKQFMGTAVAETEEIDRLYKALTPDNIEMSGTSYQFASRLDTFHANTIREMNPETEEVEQAFFGQEAFLEVVRGQAYPLAKSYYKLMYDAVQTAQAMGLVVSQEQIHHFKNELKELMGAETFSADEHRKINEAVVAHLVTQPGSPLFESGYLDKKTITENHIGDNPKIVKLMQEAKKIPGISSHPIIPYLTVGTAVIPTGRVSVLRYDNTFSRTRAEKNRITRAWANMIDNPSQFGEEHAQVIKELGEALVTNTVITTGFSPGPHAMFEYFPQSLLENIRNKDGVSLGEHMHNEVSKLDGMGGNGELTIDFMEEFLQNHMHQIFRIPAIDVIDPTAPEVVAAHKGPVALHNFELPDGVDLQAIPVVYVRVKINEGGKTAVYRRAKTKGLPGFLNEVHLREVDGKKAQGSMLRPGLAGIDIQDKLNQTIQFSKDIELELQKDSSPDAKIEKLTNAFRKAGIFVVVQKKTLIKGLKGTVNSRDPFRPTTISLDPEQLTEDTVYHEFGHILVDMLPADQVDAFIAQVKRARPALYRAVKGSYPELSERQVGIETLVTAIGIEGARLERQNPSPLQRLINRFLRAIQRMLGITPDGAAILAEELFAGEIRRELRSGTMTEGILQSRTLQADIENTYQRTVRGINIQVAKLEQLPESEKTKDDVLKLEQLRSALKTIRKTKTEVGGYLEFQEYVLTKVEEMKREFNEVNAQLRRQSELTDDEKLELVNRVIKIQSGLHTLLGTNAGDSTVTQIDAIIREVSKDKENLLEGQITDLRTISGHLHNAILDLNQLDNRYMKLLIPAVADVLADMANPEIANKIEARIKQIEESGDAFSGMGALNRDPDVRDLRARRKQMDPAEYKEEMMKLKVSKLRAKKPGRSQIIQELTNAHIDKTAYSAFMDPIVYSNEQNVQLFALKVKSSINDANEDFRGLLYKMNPVYQAFIEAKGFQNNVAKLNEDMLEEVMVKVDGEYIPVLHLVQEFDVNRFYKERREMEENLKDKYNWPRGPKGNFLPENAFPVTKWRKADSKRYDAYKSERTAWYDTNTEPVAKAQERYNKMLEETKKMEARWKEIKDSDDWTERNEASILFNRLQAARAEMRLVYDSKRGKFTGSFTQPTEKYANSKYKKIINDPALKKYYTAIKNAMFTHQKMIGKSAMFRNNWDTFSYQIPAYRKKTIDRLQEQGVIATAKDLFADGLKFQETDTEFGMPLDVNDEPIKSIPVYGTQRIHAKDISRDLMGSVLMFSHMALQFKHKSKIQGLVAGMLSIHDQRRVLKMSGIGTRITNTLAGTPNEVASIEGSKSNTYKHLEDFIDMAFYGQLDKPSTVKVGGKSLNKIASLGTTMTALNSLAGNLLQVGNQGILDNLMAWEEGFAGQFYSRANLRQARLTYAASGGALADAGKFVPKTKLGQAMQMFDALNEVSDFAGQRVTGGRLKKAVNIDSAFVLQHAVEHETAATRMLAMMYELKGKLKDKDGKVLLNEKGEEANLWDMLIQDKDGKFIVDPRVANFNRNQFIAKLHGVQKRTNQIKGNFDRAAGQRTPIGKLVLLFRGYFSPWLRKRFGHADGYHIDHEMGEITQGMYISTVQMLKRMITDRSVKGVYQTMLEEDKQNFKRTMYELGITVASMAIFRLLHAAMADADDDEKYWLAFGAYQARRLSTEMMSMANPREFIRLLDSPTATYSFVNKYWNFMDQTFFKELPYRVGLGEVFGIEEKDIVYQRDSGIWSKGDNKWKAKAAKLIPLLEGWSTTMTPEEKVKWFMIE